MNRDRQILLVSILVGIFIYFRKIDYYELIPRNNIFTALIISIWSYVSLKQPWVIIAGLAVLILLDILKVVNSALFL